MFALQCECVSEFKCVLISRHSRDQQQIWVEAWEEVEWCSLRKASRGLWSVRTKVMSKGVLMKTLDPKMQENPFLPIESSFILPWRVLSRYSLFGIWDPSGYRCASTAPTPTANTSHTRIRGSSELKWVNREDKVRISLESLKKAYSFAG